MRRFAGILYALFAAALPARAAQPESPVAIPSRAIGYTQHATALPGGRLANVATGRAMLLMPGSRPVMLAADLTDEPGSWTQFVGWFPDGKTVIIGFKSSLGNISSARGKEYGANLTEWTDNSLEYM